MKVTVGNALAPAQYDEPSFDELRCNRHVLLELLEQRLGLTGVRPTTVQRILAFHEALTERIKEGDALFRKSCEMDPLAVSERLLRWRDELVLAGWDRSTTDLGSRRLKQLAEVESHLSPDCLFSEGDRLIAVCAELSRRSAGELQVVSRDPFAWYPPRWQRLLDQLDARYESIPIQMEFTNDLHRVQSCLGGGSATVQLDGDGSVGLIVAQSETTLAETAAELISRSSGERVIISGRNQHLLESSLQRRNFPIADLATPSSESAIPQLLPMALSLCWEPLDLNALSNFLLHPRSPVGSEAAKRILKTLGSHAGIGGPDWKAALSEEGGETAREWIEIEHCVSSDAEIATIGRIADQMAGWAKSQLQALDTDSVEQQHWKRLKIRADEFSQQARKLAPSTREETERLLELILRHNPPETRAVPELGHVPAISTNAMSDRVETVYWWDFSEPSAETAPPWTPTEIIQLRTKGIFPETHESLTARGEAVHTRALMAAKRKLILFAPRHRNGSAVPEHPFWTRLQILSDNCSRLTKDMDKELLIGSGTSNRFGLRKLQPKPLRSPERWMRLPVQVGDRSCESFSSLERFIQDPFEWLCKYPANLSAGPVWGTRFRIDQRLSGQVVHRLIERLFPHQDPPLKWQVTSNRDLSDWVRKEWPTLLREEALMMLCYGNRHHALALQRLAENAILDLVQMLRNIRVVRAVADWRTRPQKFFGGLLSGNIDLLGYTDNHRPVVVDFKLGNVDKRRKETENNRALQLAVYGYLASTDRFAPPPTGAYFVLNDREWVTDDEEFFFNPGPATALTVPRGNRICWRDFRRLWSWRRELLAEGSVELVRSGAESTPESAPPVSGWIPFNDSGSKSDYIVLHGFKEDE